MKNYRFNYNFLALWQKANKGIISRDEILRGLGTKNTGSLGKWKRGEVAMPIESMLRLCNTFDIDLSNFFFDNERLASFSLRAAMEGDQIAPTGYGKKDEPDFHRESMNPYDMPDEEEDNGMVAEDIPEETERRHYDRLRKEFERQLDEIRDEHRQQVLSLAQALAELRMSVDVLSQKLDGASTLPDAKDVAKEILGGGKRKD